VFRVWEDSHKSTQGWKVCFWGSIRGKFSVNNKMNDFLGIFVFNITFTSAFTSCYQVHADAQLYATLLCYLWCSWCRSLAAVNWILHCIIVTLCTLHTRASSCITLLWLYHNHKLSVNYHKNGFVSTHQTDGRWFIFMCFVVRIF